MMLEDQAFRTDAEGSSSTSEPADLEDADIRGATAGHT